MDHMALRMTEVLQWHSNVSISCEFAMGLVTLSLIPTTSCSFILLLLSEFICSYSFGSVLCSLFARAFLQSSFGQNWGEGNPPNGFQYHSNEYFHPFSSKSKLSAFIRAAHTGTGKMTAGYFVGRSGSRPNWGQEGTPRSYPFSWPNIVNWGSLVLWSI